MKKTLLLSSLFALVFSAGCASNSTPATPSTNENYSTTTETTTESTTLSATPSPTEQITTNNSDTKITTTTPIEETYTLTQIAEHTSQTDCRTTINGKVYNITSYVPKHPGGIKQIMRVCGTDGTQAFSRKHDGDTKPKDILASFQIGVLQK